MVVIYIVWGSFWLLQVGARWLRIVLILVVFLLRLLLLVPLAVHFLLLRLLSSSVRLVMLQWHTGRRLLSSFALTLLLLLILILIRFLL